VSGSTSYRPQGSSAALETEPEGELEPETVSTFAALAVRNYRLFFIGQGISNTGTWMQRIAQDWLVLQLTNSPLAVGITTALQFLPMLLLGLWGGLIADRYPKRRLLLMTQTAMGVLATVLAVLTITGHVHVWHVYLIAFGLGLATVVDNPARQTFVNEMVPHALVRNAVSLNVGNFQLARMTGPAIAGVLIGAVGSGWAFSINAVSYVAVLVGLLLMRPAELDPQPVRERGPGQIREGLRYVRSQPQLLWPIVLVFFVGTFGYNWAIILSAYARDVFSSGAGVYGLFNTAIAAGSVVGALLAARRNTGRLAVLFGCAIGVGVLLVLVGLTPWFWAFTALLVVTGLLSVTFNTLGNSTVQLRTDPALRGRVMSLYMLVFMGGTPLGSIVVGAVTERWGAPLALILSGSVCVVSAAASALLAARSRGVALHVDLHRGAEHHVSLVQHAA
jgi:MFS family permease